MCLTNTRKYQANYAMKTKLINDITVISVHEVSKYLQSWSYFFTTSETKRDY